MNQKGISRDNVEKIIYKDLIKYYQTYKLYFTSFNHIQFVFFLLWGYKYIDSINK